MEAVLPAPLRLARLGPLAVGRPAPTIGAALAGMGGAVVAVGVILLGGHRWTSSGSAALGLVLTAALLTAGAGASAIEAGRIPAGVAVAGVGASGLAAPGLAFFVSAGGGIPSLREVAVLTGLLLCCLYLVGPWRGHTFHLAILAVAAWVLALAVANTGLDRVGLGGFDSVAQALSGAGTASMLVGVLYLGLGSWLHDEGLEGMATPFLAVAAVALPLGIVALLRDGTGVLQGLAAVVSGGAIAAVAARCRRRGGIWIGVGIGAVGIGVMAHGFSGRTEVAAALVILAGAGLVFLAPLASALLAEPAPEPTPDDRP